MSKPMELSGNKNTIAQDFYVFMAFMGALFLFGSEPIKYIVHSSSEYGLVLAKVWAALLIIGAMSALRSMAYEEAERFLKQECWATLIVGSMMLWILVSVAVAGALTPFGAVLMAFFVSGGLRRSNQTRRELKKVRTARATPALSLGEYLAEPEKNTPSQ